MDIRDDWYDEGYTMEKLRQVCDEMSRDTLYIPCLFQHLTILSYAGERQEQGKTVSRWAKLSPKAVDIFCNRGAQAGKLTEFVTMSQQSDIIKENIRNTGMMLLNETDKRHVYLVSNVADMTLFQRMKTGGEYVATPSLARDVYAARNSQREAELGHAIMLVLRTDGKLWKVFAGMSKTYPGFPVSDVCDAAQYILKQDDLGKGELVRWRIDHKKIEVYLEFPEAAKKYQEQYGFREAVVPGIMLVSSDTGYSSIICSETLRPENSEYPAIISKYDHKHTKKSDTMALMTEDARNVIEHIPQTQRELREMMDKKIGVYLDLSEAADRKKNRDLIDSYISRIYKTLQFGACLPDDTGNDLVRQMTNKTDPSKPHTWYDIAMLMLDAPSIIGDTASVGRNVIAACAGRVVGLNIKRPATERTALAKAGVA